MTLVADRVQLAGTTAVAAAVGAKSGRKGSCDVKARIVIGTWEPSAAGERAQLGATYVMMSAKDMGQERAPRVSESLREPSV